MSSVEKAKRRLPWMFAGRVIAETIKFSRTKPHIGTGDFLQIDNGMIYDKQKEVLTHIDNAPLDPDKGYDMVVPYRVLSGTLVPFVDWVHANRNQVPPSPHCGMTIQVCPTDRLLAEAKAWCLARD